MTEFILIGLIMACWVVGGQIKGRIRDIPVPILIGLGIWLNTKSWLIGLISIATYQIIRLGYGNYSPEDDPRPSFLASILKDRQGAMIRAVYGLLVAIVGAFPLVVGHYLSLPKYCLYGAVNAIIGYLVSKLRFPVLIADILVAGGVSSILLTK